MRVALVPLRERGHKLPKGALKAELQGELTLRPEDTRGLWERAKPIELVPVASFAFHEDGMLLLRVLEEASVTRIGADSLVITGYEQVYEPKGTVRYPQAWWCKLPGLAMPAERPSEVEA